MAANKALLQMIALAKRAGRLVWGTDAVGRACRNGSAQLVLYSTTLADRTKRQVLQFCEHTPTEALAFGASLEEIEWMIGKRTGVLAITDRGFGTKIRSLVCQEEEETAYDD